MVPEKPEQIISENQKESSSEKELKYMRALAELIYDSWRVSVKPEKALIPTEKIDVPL